MLGKKGEADHEDTCGPFRALAVLSVKSSGTLMDASRPKGAMLRSVF